MKNINLRFERDASLDDIDVTIRAEKRDNEVEALIKRIRNGYAETINAIDDDGTVKVVKSEDIISFSVSRKITSIITPDSRYQIIQPLQSLEKQLDEKKFIRISRYEIINLSKVVKFDFTLGGTLRIELEGGIETWASRRCIPVIRKRLSVKE